MSHAQAFGVGYEIPYSLLGTAIHCLIPPYDGVTTFGSYKIGKTGEGSDLFHTTTSGTGACTGSLDADTNTGNFSSGGDTGVYGLDITIDGDNTIAFSAEEGVPITPQEVHTYIIDKSKIDTGQDWVTVYIDKNGDGVNDFEVTSDGDLTADEFAKMIPITTIENPGNLEDN